MKNFSKWETKGAKEKTADKSAVKRTIETPRTITSKELGARPSGEAKN